MQLTGKQIIKQGIIFGECKEGIQQQGVDVRLTKVFRVRDNNTGYVPVKGKTVIPKSVEVTPFMNNDGSYRFDLTPGYYEVEFEEGCEMPKDCAMYFKTRSSLVRCGAEIISGQFDGGFETEHMGAFLNVRIPITIDVGARVAQAIVTETYPVDIRDMYDGQWQNDKQRK